MTEPAVVDHRVTYWVADEGGWQAGEDRSIAGAVNRAPYPGVGGITGTLR